MSNILPNGSQAYMEPLAQSLIPNIAVPYSVNILDSRHIKFLDEILIDYRSRGMYVIPGKNKGDPVNKWSGAIYIPKTDTLYQMLLSDRPQRTVPDDIKKGISGFCSIDVHNRITQITRSIFKDPETFKRFCKKGYDLNVNWTTVFSKNKYNHGYEQLYFEIDEDFRNFFNCVYYGVSTAKNLSRRSREYLISNIDTYSSASGLYTQLKAIEILLMSIDTFNTAVTSLIATSPVQTQAFRDFVSGYKDSRDFAPELLGHFDNVAINHYTNVVCANGVADGIFFK